MLPLTFDPRMVRAGLAGAGEGFERRRALLAEAGLEPVVVSPDTDAAGLGGVSLLFVAGLDRPVAERLASQARSQGILVNVEDVPTLCDFHVPAIVRRGAMTLAVSTAGRSPGLARRLREWLSETFGPAWAAHAEALGDARDQWRAEGLSPQEVSERTRAMIRERGWL